MLVALVGGTAVVGTTGVASAKGSAKVTKMAEKTTSIFKIEAKEGKGTPPGCVNGCPTITTNLPSLIAQDETYSDIAGATEIDTFTSNQNCGPGGCTSTQSGCAVVTGALWCWGGNSQGQLGTGDTKDVTKPTKSLENGQSISGVTDISTNGSTTCIVDDGAVKCVGSGNFNSYKTVTRTISETITTWTSPNSSSNSSSSRCEVDQLDANGTVVSSSTACGMSSTSSVVWQTIVASDAKKVQVGSGSSSTPPICVLMATGKVDCLLSSTSTSTSPMPGGSGSSSQSTTYDCDGNAADFESTNWCSGGTYPFRSKSANAYSSESPAVKLNWQSVSGVTAAVDISMPSESWGASSLCIAAAGAATCRTFSNGTIGKSTTIKGAEGAEAVWVTSGWGPSGLCVYASGVMKCGAGTSGPTGSSSATSVTPVAVMEKPLSVFYGTTSNLNKIYFLLPSGILSADSWIFSCNSCYSSQGSSVAPVTAFSDAAAKSFFKIDGVTGATDSAEFIPLSLTTGTRNSRSSVQITLKAGSQSLVGTSVKWMAPDYPGQYQSSSTSSLTTDANGIVKTSLVSGPVTFTLSGGSISSGATLQAASVTVLVPDTGNVDVSVPLPGDIVQRKVSVTLPDASAVPNATVTLRNNYLTYAYANAGGSTSSWSSRAKDTKGWFAQTNCAYCYAPPPVYITGNDGSVTFPSFNTGSRSTAYDADVSYDDGELSQNVQATFATTDETVAMTFMAKVAVKVNDADKATPDVEVDADSDGEAEIPVEIKQETGEGISDKEVSAEDVCDGMESGGLWSSGLKVDSICSSGVSKSAVGGVRVSKFACKSSGKASTDGAGKATIKLCPTKSTRIRLRGTGTLASTIICVRVKGLACAKSTAGSSLAGGGVAGVAPKLSTKGKISRATILKNYTAVKGAGAIKYTASGACKVVGANVIGIGKAGTCKIKVTQAAKGKVKGAKPKMITVKVT